MKRMNQTILLQAIILMRFASLFSQQNDWENPRVFEINKIPGRATSISYASIDQALMYNYNESDRFLSLNGDWKFSFADQPSLAPSNIWEQDVR